jgi:hypothetical protein
MRPARTTVWPLGVIKPAADAAELADIRLRPPKTAGSGRAKTPDHMGCAEDGAPGAKIARAKTRGGPLPTSEIVFALGGIASGNGA